MLVFYEASLNDAMRIVQFNLKSYNVYFKCVFWRQSGRFLICTQRKFGINLALVSVSGVPPIC